MSDETTANPNPASPEGRSAMWGGRFAGGPSAVMESINASIGFDIRLAAQDIAGSRAHADMLVAQGILSSQDGSDIHRGLDQIAGELAAGQFVTDPALEDIHMHIEARLAALIGDAAKRLHTARSRNDQVATDFKLWVREACQTQDQALKAFIIALMDQAQAHADSVMPGFTHLQTAQPVTLGHHLMAYVEMARRDRDRLQAAARRLNQCPLGSAALAGTGFPIDRQATAQALGFDDPTANSLDAVSDRDFALDYLSALAIGGMHLSRLAEEMVIWASAPFGFLTLSDSFSTGSSIMPQKRNPDAAELVRAKTGRLFGNLQALLVAMKGLPLAYSKDMQEDKEPVFEARDAYDLMLAAMTGMIRDLALDQDRMATEAGRGYATATDLADWLVREAGVPFRDAHHITGSLVAKAEAKSCDLKDLTLADMQVVDQRITVDIFDVLSVEASVASRTSYGGTAPSRVREQITAVREALEAET